MPKVNTVSLAGLDYDQAVKKIEATLGETLPDEVKDHLKKTLGAGGKFEQGETLADMKDYVGGDPEDYELAQHDAVFRSSREGQALIAEFGEPPPYNGVVGDSCPCQVCNLRRSVTTGEGGVSYTRDMDRGETVDESEAMVVKHYAKRGMKVSANATREASYAAGRKQALDDHEGFHDSDNPFLQMSKAGVDISALVSTLPRELADSLLKHIIPGARKSFENVIGKGNPALKDFDYITSVLEKPRGERTVEEMEKAIQFCESLSAVLEARGASLH